MSSKPYFFHSQGAACLSGIEVVSGQPWPDTVWVELTDGDHEVVIRLIDWEAEPGSLADGKPSAAALADFVVLVNPVSSASEPFRVEIETFDRGQ